MFILSSEAREILKAAKIKEIQKDLSEKGCNSAWIPASRLEFAARLMALEEHDEGKRLMYSRIWDSIYSIQARVRRLIVIICLLACAVAALAYAVCIA